MNIKAIKTNIKPIILQLFPKYYYHRLIHTGKEEKNVNCYQIANTLSVPYDPAGKYPTMYTEPQDFYEERKRKMAYDQNGIPMYRYQGTPIYHPVYLIQWGLSEFGYYLSTHNDTHLETAKLIADWLLKNQDKKNGLWYYPYDYVHEFTNCKLTAPWASAMAQGQAVSLLTRIYRLTKDEKYIAASIKAIAMLDVPVSDGGFAAEVWGHTIFEEYPTIPYSLTLNGFMFCALGLYDLTTVIDDEKARQLWEVAKQALEAIVPLYDGDLMSVYCLSYVNMGNIKRHWAEHYHPLHITLLQCFESIMPNPTFEFYIRRWAKFLGIKIGE